MTILINVLLVIFVLVALLMILVILMQRPKSEGLGAAFGGGMTENLFGAQTTNVLVKFTGWLAGIFFVLTFGLSILYAHRGAPQSGLRQELMKTETKPGPVIPIPQPAPSSAVGAPGTVTNPTPATIEGVSNGQPLTPADQAVGITAPAVPPAEASVAPVVPASPAPKASAKPSP